MYTIGSIFVLFTTYVKYKRKRNLLYEPLISGQANSSYGAINSEESNIEDDSEEETDDKPDPTFSTGGHSRNKMYDLSRLFFGVMMFMLFGSVGFVRWREYDDDEYDVYWLSYPIIEELVWVRNKVHAILKQFKPLIKLIHVFLDVCVVVIFYQSLISAE